MLEQVLSHLKNWFQIGIYPDTYRVENGRITLPFLRDGQYFRIVGSIFNDGLHRYGPDMEALTDETFTGAVWPLAIPKAVIDLAGEMSAWQERYGAKAAGIYQSESKADYNYTKRTNSSGNALTVFDVFWTRLNPYRKLREI